MFFRFADGLVFQTRDLVVIWEVEVAMSAVLREASESEKVLRLPDLGLQAVALLKARGLPDVLVARGGNEIDFLVTQNAVTLAEVLKRLERSVERESFKADLAPERIRILEAVKNDGAFAEHLSLSLRK
jgi:hypothetical protein